MFSILDGVKPLQTVVKKDNKLWTTEKVNKWLDNYQNGIENTLSSPFEDGKIGFRKGNLNFQYTDWELEEIEKCANDINYFTDKYCYSMTDEGIRKITLHPFQRKVLRDFQDHRFNVFLASRQVGKCSVGLVNINIKQNNTIKSIKFYQLYFNELRKLRKLTFLEKTKYFLYNLLDKLCKKTIKLLIRNIILFLIEVIEFIEYRKLNLNENDISKKIIETLDVSNENIEIETDTGFYKITHLHKTQPYKIYKLITSRVINKEELHLKNKELLCADNHIVFNKNMNQVFVKDLKELDHIKTKDGLEYISSIEILNNKVSMFDCTINSSDHRFYTNDILSHNTVSSSFFITWYLSFNIDKNCLIVANKGATVKEIIDKIKIVYENLPFFLKPGILINNVMSMKFDNGCRFMGQNTSKTPGLGFTIHLLYADEFAHIPSNIINHFYRSVFPTLSSSKISRAIITSTAYGMNKFYEIYTGAVKGENEFNPIRVDWFDYPGRDEDWKQKEIANLGSQEEFRQEYENQFFSDSQMAIDRWTMQRLARIKKKYEWYYLDEFEYEGVNYNNLIWDSKYRDFTFNKLDKFLLSIDTASGAGKDFSVINIFKVEPLSLAKIRTLRNYEDEGSFFKLIQIGIYRDNHVSIDELSKILKVLIFDFFGEENIKIILEMNHSGAHMIVANLEKHPEYYPELFIHTKHSLNAERLELGVKLNKSNKPLLCSEMGHLIKTSRIVMNEFNSIQEASNFGIDSKGNYKSQLGNDDIIMTCVNAVYFFQSLDYYEIIEDIIDYIDDEKRYLIYEKLENKVESVASDFDYSIISSM